MGENTYEVKINYGLLIKAKSEEEAKETFRNIFDSTSFKLDVKEFIAMKKDNFIKWRGKYKTDSKPMDFSLDMKDLNKIGLKHKEVLFASLTREEYNCFDRWTKKNQLQFLEDYWNYYMSMMS